MRPATGATPLTTGAREVSPARVRDDRRTHRLSCTGSAFECDPGTHRPARNSRLSRQPGTLGHAAGRHTARVEPPRGHEMVLRVRTDVRPHRMAATDTDVACGPGAHTVPAAVP